MCEGRLDKKCSKCPYFYNSEFCLLEDDYIDEDNYKIIEVRSNNETIKISRVYSRT